jgi:hypothetical protein
MLLKLALVALLTAGASACGGSQAGYDYGFGAAYSQGPCYNTFGDAWSDPTYGPCPTSAYYYGQEPFYLGMSPVRLDAQPRSRAVIVRQHAPVNRGGRVMVRGQGGPGPRRH